MPAKQPCRSILDASLPPSQLAKAVRSCGYAHIGPGLFPAEYVAALAEHVRRYDGNSTAFDSGAAGGRINLVPAPEGPFAEDRPFTQPTQALYELMQKVLAPGQCCHLFLLSVMLALPAGGDQLFHRDQMRRFRAGTPWTKGEWNHCAP